MHHIIFRYGRMNAGLNPDERGRMIQSYSQTDERGSYLHSFFNPNWVGEIKASRETYYFKPPTGNYIAYTLQNDFTYDHAGRVTSTVVSLKSGSQTLTSYTSENHYDALGRLVSDSINGNKINSRFDYNIRDWLTGITSKGANSNLLMDFQLMYEDHPLSPEYGGNISSTDWKYGSLPVNTYDFSYDALGRLSEAAYSPDNHYSSFYHYDSNGNLLGLERMGKTDGGFSALIDSLEYRYAYNSNRLTWVLNKSGNTGEGAFDNMGLNPYDSRQLAIYEYDANGNMRRDHRTLRTISYNFLNLPSRVLKDNSSDMIAYMYTATGVKLSQALQTGKGGKRREK